MPKQVVFFGSSPLSNVVLQKLIDAGVVSAVVTKEDKPEGRHLKMTPNPVKVLAEKYNIPVSTVPVPGEIALVAAYGKIIPQSTLDTFSGQVYNIHPSLLPKYRGPSPLPQQILDDAKDIGVTLIQIDAQMDHGPVVAQDKGMLLTDDNWISLGQRLFAKGADLFLKAEFTDLQPQDDSQATYTKKITRQDGFVPWEDFEPKKLRRKLQAYWDWPGVWTLMPDNKRLKLISIFPNIMIQIEGKQPQPWKTI